mgnify:CR=1 FL=1
MTADTPGAGDGTYGEPLAGQFDVLLLDLDGVIYLGSSAVPHAVESLTMVQRTLGLRSAYVTNNASRTPGSIADQLRGFGLRLSDRDIVTSAQAGVRVLRGCVPAGATVLVVGGPGLKEEVELGGFVAVESASEQPAAVIQGFFPDVTWRRLAEATFALRAGAVYVATNADLTIPVEGGIAPGNGLLVGVVAQASGVQPTVAGKPEPPLMLESVARTGAQRPLVVGDRLDTDILGAGRSDLPSLLVLTGVSGVADVFKAEGLSRPTYLGLDLRALLEPATRAEVVRDDTGSMTSVCRRTVARIDDERLNLVGDTGDHGGAPTGGSWQFGVSNAPAAAGLWLDGLRAASALAWAARDAGLDVDCSDVIDQLQKSRPRSE